MKLQERKTPRILEKLNAMIPRLRTNYPRLGEIKRDLLKREKGYIGELNVDYFTNFLADQFTVLEDICLDVGGNTVQLDTVVATGHALFIVDSKNYHGTITFDTTLEQLTREEGKLETGFEYPINQVELQRFKLQQWLQAQGIPQIPVYFFIVISQPSTIIKVIGDRDAIGKVVSHASGLPKKLLEKNEQIATENAYKFQHQKVGRMISQACRAFDKDVVAEYGITLRDLQPGVCCQNCGQLGMERIYGNWRCKKCNYQSRYAHKLSIQHYLLLNRPWIRNEMCRYWLQISSRATATRCLKTSDLVYNPKRKSWYI